MIADDVYQGRFARMEATADAKACLTMPAFFRREPGQVKAGALFLIGQDREIRATYDQCVARFHLFEGTTAGELTQLNIRPV